MGVLYNKKTCVGWDNNPHEAFIYKNVDGKKYCASCFFKIFKPKKNVKNKILKEKKKTKAQIKKELYILDVAFYNTLWKSHYAFGTIGDKSLKRLVLHGCYNCNKNLDTEIPITTYFHHILPKAKYELYRHNPANIMILCPRCHHGYEAFPDKFPKIERIKNKYLEYIDISVNIAKNIYYNEIKNQI